MAELITKIDGWVWGPVMMVLIIGVGILLSVRTGWTQRRIPIALKYAVNNEEGGEGDVSSFGALTTALAATVGTGNIVGVATAIMAGGPGALFWMELAAFFGIATKYAEGLLAVKYRQVKEDGTILGGPFYYIEKGMGPSWKWLGKLFALFGSLAGALGIGTSTQVNSIVSAVNQLFDPNNEHIAFGSYSWTTVIAAVVVTVAAILVIIGGIERIAEVASKIVPAMMVIYVVTGLLVFIWNIKAFPGAIVEIVRGAFGLDAAAGGAFGAFMLALQKGVARGIFSNEAGLGSAPIAAAAAQTKECARQGLVSSTGTFLDTIVICTMTGLCIVMTGADDWAHANDQAGVAVTIRAFGEGLPWPNFMGAVVLSACLALFAFTTILGWDYYAERCFDYLTNGNKGAIAAYRWLYIAAVAIGPFVALNTVWDFADMMNGLMAFPNLIALFALSGVVAKETKDFWRRKDAGEYDDGLAAAKAAKEARKAK
ncbi:MAG: sodium:alanine symporter family protein [Mogibacterium sp.]|nr:sodium:alanine symporter family protein [Mogibacterium sp.]MBR2539813.1 sodium:alanine symporter family protein [Mogibacterium sp.]